MYEQYQFFLKDQPGSEWREVSLEAYCRAERAAGFRPKLPRTDPAYMTTPATGGFGSGGISGRMEHMPHLAVDARGAQELTERDLLTSKPATPARDASPEWIPVSESLPPASIGSLFSDDTLSDMVWLALSNGQVIQGYCLHCDPGATKGGPAHTWRVGNRQIDGEITVEAWMPIVAPNHPRAMTRS